MRSAFVVLFLALAVLATLYFLRVIQIHSDAISLHLGTTEVTATYTSFAVVTGWIVGMLFSLTGLIATGFKGKTFLLLLLLFVIGGGFIFYTYIYN